jgi:hypothetical protein
MYRLEKEDAGKKQVQEIVETKVVLSVAFSPPTAAPLTPNSSRKRTGAFRGL